MDAAAFETWAEQAANVAKKIQPGTVIDDAGRARTADGLVTAGVVPDAAQLAAVLAAVASALRDTPAPAAAESQVKAANAARDALRDAIRAVAADPDVPITDSVADAVALAASDVPPMDAERLARVRERVFAALATPTPAAEGEPNA